MRELESKGREPVRVLRLKELSTHATHATSGT